MLQEKSMYQNKHNTLTKEIADQYKSMKLENLIKKVPYYYVNSDINSKNFPVPEKVETENWKLIRLNKTVSSEEALEEIKKQGYRPANCYELATWAISHRDELKKYEWAVAFGQLWEDAGGYHRVPSVDASSDGDFNFLLGNFEDVWRDDDAFLCFSDVSLDTEKLSPSLNLGILEKMQKDIEDLKQSLLGK